MSIADDWGLEEGEENPLNLGEIPSSRLSSLAFLFGGAGDGELNDSEPILTSDLVLSACLGSSSSRIWLNNRT